MPIAFRSVNSSSSGAGVTSFNCPNPAGIVTGDVLVLVVHAWKSGGGGATISCSGWTSRGQHVYGSGDSCAVFTKTADGSEGANTTVTFNASSLVTAGIVAYSGASGIDAVADFGSSQTSATATVPSVTTTVADDMIVGISVMVAASSATQASGWTERLDRTGAGSGALVYAMEKTQASVGASPTAQPTASGSSATWTFAVAVKAPAAVTPVADFTGTPLTGTAPLTVAFTDTSTNTPTSWAWDFGDGSTSTSQNPSHSYTNSGVFTVALTATNATGSNTKTRTAYITVSEAIVYASGGGVSIW